MTCNKRMKRKSEKKIIKYINNGWENYKLAWGTYPETSKVIKARQIENEQWWK